jgi:2-methylcitrate dehydratase PrpD
MTRITEELLEFVASTRFDDMPREAVLEAKRALMNFFATALGGCADAAVDKAAAVLGRFAGTRAATVIGRGARSDMLNAACLNAMSANVFDFDDTHVGTIIHPTAPVAPALLAWAETTPMTGPQFLLAFVLGVEAECRLGNAVSPWHYQRGWHITSTCGVFGSAVATGKAIGLDVEHLRWAVGNASAQASGLVETLGSMSKSLGVGNSARNGLLSALLAREGFAGPAEPIEGERGFLRVMGQDADVDALVDGLGDRWEILSNTYKPYPCGIVLHPVIDACLELAGKHVVRAADVARIDIAGHPLLRERTDRPRPSTGREAQVSAQHAVAAALTLGRAGLPEFSDEAVADPAMRAFADKVRFVDGPRRAVDSASISVIMSTGQGLSASVQNARGSLARPLSDAELERKLIELAQYGKSGLDPHPLIEAIWSLERVEDAGRIMALATGRARTGRGAC